MISVQNLSKRYGDYQAVNDVSFTCEPGTITGFLGPNGAGKSTTMRMICGLTPPDSGTTTVSGLNFGDIPNPGREIGVLLDASAQHTGRTGREVLRVAAMTMGVPLSRADEMLEFVGLPKSAANRRTGDYSLGMRQRLGIAYALLGDPRVLMLDEPANGLDPEGIFWMRSLLRQFADRGGTVLLSSHLLHEIEVVADRLVVIAGGKIVAQGTKEELLSGSSVKVQAEEIHKLSSELSRQGVHYTESPDGSLLVEASAAQVGRLALTSQVVLTELRDASSEGLEGLFFQLTNGESDQPQTGQSSEPALVA